MAVFIISILLHFTLKQMLAKYTSLKFNALSTHLLSKQIVYFDKNVLIVLLFYDYSSVQCITIQTQFYNYLPYTFMVVVELL